MKNIAYWEESEQREVLANKFVLSEIELEILVLVRTPGKLFFFTFLILEIAFPALKLTENCYLKITFIFLEKWQFNHNWLSLSSANILCLKDYPHNVAK